jgi:ABC-type transporter Mla subunit MlaD
MSDTAPHFIDSTKTNPDTLLNSAVDVTRQDVDAAQDAAGKVADRTAKVADQAADAVQDNGARASSVLSEVNKTLAETFSQSLSEMNALAQQAMRIRTPQDLLAYQQESYAHFKNNITTVTNIYALLWRSTTDTFSSMTGTAKDISNTLRQAA